MVFQHADVVEVRAWGQRVGAVAAGRRRDSYVFAYDPEWVASGREVAPILMPLDSRRRYSFPALSEETFKFLPPMLADALPDRFGSSLVNAWLARQGVPVSEITPLDRLAYLGNRGLGALEFVPSTAPNLPAPAMLDIKALVDSARHVISGELTSDAAAKDALRSLISVGTSAGGARAKAIVRWNQTTGEIRPESDTTDAGFSSWLIKFDGVGVDKQLGSSQSYGRIEYAYSLMAAVAGVQMAETKLLEENGRAHFITRRFDRPDASEKLHLQSLCAVDAVDFNLIETNDYAQYFSAIESLSLGADAREQAFRRMVFNVFAANCDDHSKNFAFLMDNTGAWSLAPAYDVTFAHEPGHKWLSKHLMAVDGKFADITRDDLMGFADKFSIERASRIISDIRAAVGSWTEFATAAGVPAAAREEIAANIRPGT